jgi:hypothetical protein
MVLPSALHHAAIVNSDTKLTCAVIGVTESGGRLAAWA